MANPQTVVEVGRERRPVLARRATPEEKAEIWPHAVAVYGGYADYQRQADEIGRDIPLVILDPA